MTDVGFCILSPRGGDSTTSRPFYKPRVTLYQSYDAEPSKVPGGEFAESERLHGELRREAEQG